MQENPFKTHGRRIGKALTQERKDLLIETLPQYRIDLPELLGTHPDTFFSTPYKAYWMEIGFGDGEHMLFQARRNQDVGIIGCEPFVNGYAALFKKMADQDAFQENIRIWTANALPLLEKFQDHTLSRIDLLFPDPWPKSRHHKRRFITPETLGLLHRVLKPAGEFRIATDHGGYQHWVETQMAACPLFQRDLTQDLLTEPQDWTRTKYQQKALREGRIPQFYRFIPK